MSIFLYPETNAIMLIQRDQNQEREPLKIVKNPQLAENHS